MRATGGRVVGKLVQDADGLWHEAAPAADLAVLHKRATLADFVRALFNQGRTRSQIALEFISREGLAIALGDGSLKVATVYRQVDQALLDGGIRARAKARRGGPTGKGTGSANLPSDLVGL